MDETKKNYLKWFQDLQDNPTAVLRAVTTLDNDIQLSDREKLEIVARESLRLRDNQSKKTSQDIYKAEQIYLTYLKKQAKNIKRYFLLTLP